MPIVPLKQIAYADDQRRIIDAVNDNFRLLEWLLNNANLDAVNISPVYTVQTEEYIEYGSAAWGAAGVEFVLVNGYTYEPVVTAGVQGNAADFATAAFVLVVTHVMEVIGGQECYSKVQVTPKGNSVPTPTGAKITMQAVCRGAVVKP